MDRDERMSVPVSRQVGDHETGARLSTMAASSQPLERMQKKRGTGDDKAAGEDGGAGKEAWTRQGSG